MTGGNGGQPGAQHGSELPLEELRRLVREVLADVVGTMPGAPSGPTRLSPAAWRPGSVSAGPPSPVPAAPPNSVPPADTADPAAGRIEGPGSRGSRAERDDPASWTIRIRTDEELHAFVLRVLKLAGNAKLRGDLISGRARFRLAAESAVAPVAVHQVEKGAVTERVVAAAAADGARLVLGPRAVLTPLARDKARALGVPIERAPVIRDRER
jgi:hypothetical protein